MRPKPAQNSTRDPSMNVPFLNTYVNWIHSHCPIFELLLSANVEDSHWLRAGLISDWTSTFIFLLSLCILQGCMQGLIADNIEWFHGSSRSIISYVQYYCASTCWLPIHNKSYFNKYLALTDQRLCANLPTGGTKLALRALWHIEWKGGLNPRSHENSEAKLPKAAVVHWWVAFQALEFWCTLPPMILHPITQPWEPSGLTLGEIKKVPWVGFGGGGQY